jgi:hypothetical protein
VSHFDEWRDPDTGLRYRDVLEVHYWSRHPDEASREIYHLGNGLGTIRFETLSRLEPSGVRYQYAESFERFTPPDQPTLPWFDPFRNATHVHNGFCDDFLLAPVQAGPVDLYLRDWTGSADAVITTDAPDEGTGPWKVALRGSVGGGDATADFIVTSDWIPVTPGRRYRSAGACGARRRGQRTRLADGVGAGASFEDAQAMAT